MIAKEGRKDDIALRKVTVLVEGLLRLRHAVFRVHAACTRRVTFIRPRRPETYVLVLRWTEQPRRAAAAAVPALDLPAVGVRHGAS